MQRPCICIHAQWSLESLLASDSVRGGEGRWLRGGVSEEFSSVCKNFRIPFSSFSGVLLPILRADVSRFSDINDDGQGLRFQ